MNSKFHIYIAGGLYIAAMVYITATLMGGRGAYQLVRIAPLILIFMLTVIISLRRFWLAILLSTWVVSYHLPIFLFDTFSIGFLLASLVVGVYIAEKTVKQQSFFNINDVAGVLLLIAGCLILIRLLRDRPGSARMGGVGGLRYAILYSAAVPFFFVTEKLAKESVLTTKVIRFVIIAASVMLLNRIALRFHGGVGETGQPIYFNWYEGPLWILMPLVFAFILDRFDKNKLPFVVIITFCLAWFSLGLLGSFRSRPLFVIAAISAVFWCYGYKKKIMAFLIICILTTASVLPFLPKEHIPLSLRRSLSTVIQFDSREIRQVADLGLYISHETGWKSDFRASLNRMAFKQVRDNPWMGTGWGFTTDELEWASQFSFNNPAASALVVSGEYHNSLLTVAVKCGFPAALTLAVGLLLMLVQSVKSVSHIKVGNEKIMYAGLMGFLAAVSGQMLMNGGGDDLQAVCIVLGYFHGTTQKARSDITDENDIEPSLI